MVVGKAKYVHQVGDSQYDENLMNVTLIMQEIESYKDGYNDRRDYYMAQNILYLLHREKPGSKVVVWAHNGHINNLQLPVSTFMGRFLKDSLKDKYFPIGFEFYSGSFQSRNMGINNTTSNWDINTVGDPPVSSLPWYLNNTGKDMLYLDLRHMGTLRNFSQPISMHYYGSQYWASSPITFPATFHDFDGLIYIKTSTAAKNFTKVKLKE
jgi:erythromycin esterase